MANWYVSSVAYAALPQWTASTAYTVGTIIRGRATPTAGREFAFKCTTAGTTAASEPSWPASDGGTVTSGTAVFTMVSGRESEQAAGNWKAPSGTVAALPALASGDVVFVDSAHLENFTSAKAFPTSISATYTYVSVSRSGATLPPTLADYTPGAEVRTTGAFAITINAHTWMGFLFQSGVSSNSASGTINLGGAGGSRYPTRFFDCTMRTATTGSVTVNIQSASGGAGLVEMVNTNFIFDGITPNISFNCDVLWRDTPNALTFNSTQPSTFFSAVSSNMSEVIIRNVDLSAISNYIYSANYGLTLTLEGCKIRTLTGFGIASGGSNRVRASQIRLINCYVGSSGDLQAFELANPGYAVLDKSAVRTGGASDGVTGFSYRFRPNSTPTFFQFPAVARRFDGTGSKTVEVEFLHGAANALTVQDVVLEVTYPDNAGDSHLATATNKTTPLTTTALSSSSVAWDASVPLRANSTAYNNGDVIKVASAPGLVFVCIGTSGLNTASSEPAGYATATPGTQVNDGALSFRACRAQKASVTINPQSPGTIIAQLRVKLANASDFFFMDPKVTIN